MCVENCIVIRGQNNQDRENNVWQFTFYEDLNLVLSSYFIAMECRVQSVRKAMPASIIFPINKMIKTMKSRFPIPFSSTSRKANRNN